MGKKTQGTNEVAAKNTWVARVRKETHTGTETKVTTKPQKQTQVTGKIKQGVGDGALMVW